MPSTRVAPPTLGLLLAAAAALLGALLYAGCVGAEFVWDDGIVIDEQLPRFHSARDVFWPPPDIPEFSTQYYRPLTVASYLADDAIARAIWGPAETGRGRRIVFHASPVVLHALASALVVAFGLALARFCGADRALGTWAAGGAGLLFATHPVHVESVAWMAGRSDVLCGVFLLGSGVAFLRFLESQRWGWLAAATSATFGAMLAKEIGLGSVGLNLFLSALARAPGAPGDRRRAALRGAAAMGLALVGYAALRVSALPDAAPGDIAPRLGEGLAALGWYASKCVWPWPISAFHLAIPGGWTHVAGLIAAAGWIALAWMAIRDGRLRPEASAATLFAASVSLSLVIVALGTTRTPVAERYLYVPSAGVCLLMGFLLARVRRGVVVLAAAALVAIPFAVSTVVHARTWNSNLGFWEEAARTAPGAGFIRLHYGLALAEGGRPADAMVQFESAATLGQEKWITAPAQNHRGVLLLQAGDLERARTCFDRAIAVDAGYEVPRFNRAVVLLRQAAAAESPGVAEALRDGARKDLEAALRLNGRYAKAHLELGALLLRQDDPAEARRHLRAVADIAPRSPEAAEARSLLGE